MRTQGEDLCRCLRVYCRRPPRSRRRRRSPVFCRRPRLYAASLYTASLAAQTPLPPPKPLTLNRLPRRGAARPLAPDRTAPSPFGDLLRLYCALIAPYCTFIAPLLRPCAPSSRVITAPDRRRGRGDGDVSARRSRGVSPAPTSARARPHTRTHPHTHAQHTRIGARAYP